MKRILTGILSLLITVTVFSQKTAFEKLLSDSTMQNGSVSFCIMAADTPEVLFEYNSEKSLIPGSVLKLFASSAALEKLGPDYKFKTLLAYTGKLNKHSGVLEGNIIIKGGGDPTLGSKSFEEHYGDFLNRWVSEIKGAGIRKVKGRVITDDSYYNFQPIPAKWLWEDAGNYYGAGAFGLSVFDNTYEIHFKTSSDSSAQNITGIFPPECSFEFSNWLVAAGTADKGYVFAAPYSTNGWLSGTIPANIDDFVLKASIADPPKLIARIIDKKLRDSGVKITGEPTTTRLLMTEIKEPSTMVTETVSPPLSAIAEVLNHESVNMYAEHFVKELGKVFGSEGSTESGLQVIYAFLDSAGVVNPGIHIEDGSGLSPLNSVNARGLSDLLNYMKNHGRYSDQFISSLPEAGKEGTLKNYFRDHAFEGRMQAKSGSMTRVRSYSGYLKAFSGRELIFSILINNYTGTTRYNISLIEDVLKQAITDN